MKTKLNFKQSMLAGLMASIAAAFVNAVLFYIFKSLGIITDQIFVQPGQPLTIIPVIMASFVPTLIATLVFFLIEMFSNNGYKIFSILSVILLIISLVSPFMQIPGVTTGYALVLCLMHIVVVVFLLYFIKRSIKNIS